MRNGIKIVWLESEKHSKSQPENNQKTETFWTFLYFLENCPYDSNEVFHNHSTPEGAPMCAMASNRRVKFTRHDICSRASLQCVDVNSVKVWSNFWLLQRSAVVHRQKVLMSFHLDLISDRHSQFLI